MNSCLEFLQAFAELRRRNGMTEPPNGFAYKGIDEFILCEGEQFISAPLPAGVKRGRMKECYANAGRLAMSRSDLTYCEGFACNIIPVMHAWCCTDTGLVVDPTWKDAEGCDYYGVRIDTDYLRKTILRKQTWGCIDDWEGGAPMLRIGAKEQWEAKPHAFH